MSAIRNDLDEREDEITKEINFFLEQLFFVYHTEDENRKRKVSDNFDRFWEEKRIEMSGIKLMKDRGLMLL